jgi:DNA polymerase III alpha subunit
VLALSVEGYHNLVTWSNLSMDDKTGFFWRKPRISIEKMIRSAPFPLHHNVVLSGCLGSELCQSLLNLNGERGYAGASYIESMKAVFPNFYLEVQWHADPRFLDEGYENYESMCAAQAEADALHHSLVIQY